MNKDKYTYHVFLKRHGERVIQAFGYTSEEESKKVIFHTDEDSEDSETYFLESEISGIERAEIVTKRISPEDINDEFLSGLEEEPRA